MFYKSHIINIKIKDSISFMIIDKIDWIIDNFRDLKVTFNFETVSWKLYLVVVPITN